MNSFKDIAYQILKEAGKSLHSKEITKIALDRGWLKTTGKTEAMSEIKVEKIDIRNLAPTNQQKLVF